MSRIGLVGCVKQKADRPAPAAKLYISALFRGRRAFVERSCDRWFVLSALHGLVDPDDVIAPYDVTLNDMGRNERRSWSRRVLGQLETRLSGASGVTFEVHAGAAYMDFGLSDGLVARGGGVDFPVAGLRLGEQLAFYTRTARK